MQRAISIAVVVLSLSCLNAFAQVKSCEELKNEIAVKLDEKGVKNYELNIVAAEEVKSETVVGSCDGGTKRSVYKRN